MGDEIRKHALDKLREWASTKAIIVASPVIQAAVVSDEMAAALQWFVRGSKVPNRVPDVPPLDVWLKQYKRHNHMFNVIGEPLGFEPVGAGSLSWIGKAIREYSRMKPEEVRQELEKLSDDDKREIGAVSTEILSGVNSEIWSEVEDSTGGASAPELMSDDEMAKYTARPEMQFLVRVWLPCWIACRETPGKLFRKARCGDMDALDQLLRIDRSILADRIISQHWHRAVHDRSRGAYNKLLRAIKSQPRGNMTRAKIKKAMASMGIWVSGIFVEIISRVPEPRPEPFNDLSRWTLTEPEIRNVFDWIAMAKGDGLRDQEMPIGSEALAKHLNRDGKKWQALFPMPTKNGS
ncbi:hypothetical protein HED60_23745 [Planctomycetales bacterium ZRK34]|nr:hypothetical protein HED60_23745 [Planctomycetales bacterium ZRK34]